MYSQVGGEGEARWMTTEECQREHIPSFFVKFTAAAILGSDTGAPRTRQMSKCLPRSGLNTSAVVIFSWHSRHEGQTAPLPGQNLSGHLQGRCTSQIWLQVWSLASPTS